jgi:hypothetical protein
MAQPPHWLDDVFENIESAKESFMDHSRVKAAFEAAEAAHARTKADQEEMPQLMGSSPAQAARDAFIEGLGL